MMKQVVAVGIIIALSPLVCEHSTNCIHTLQALLTITNQHFRRSFTSLVHNLLHGFG